MRKSRNPEPGGPQATRKSQIFRTDHMLGTLYFTVSVHFSLEHSLEIFQLIFFN